MAPGGKQEDEESVTVESVEQPRSSCNTYIAEGDKFYRINELKKAIESYTSALDGAESEGIDKRPCYCSRAMCKLQLGDSQAALEDAEEALEQDQTYSKGLWIKAEALYVMGNFEYALMFFHRGSHLRSDNGEFQIGIQKSQKAIENAIGAKSGVELTTNCDLSYFYDFDWEGKKNKKGKDQKGKGGRPQPKTIKKEEKKREDQRPKGTKSSRKTSRRLLGELYSDKQYLEQLFEDGVIANPNSESSKKIKEFTCDAIEYLERREEFWRQQDPSQTHDKSYDRANSAKSGASSAMSKKTNPGKYIIKQIELIEADMDRGDYQIAEDKCKATLDEALIYTEEELANKQEFLATLYGLHGMALYEQDKFQQAEQQFINDYEISESLSNVDAKNRSLDNLGRVYVKLEDYTKALKFMNEKLEMMNEKPNDDKKSTNGQEDDDETMEKIWIYHEIAKCHLEKKDFENSKEFGQKALLLAKEAKDEGWQLNASIIVAKSEEKLEDFENAATTFEEALELAKLRSNEEAQESIEKALREVNQKLSRKVIEQENSNRNEDESNDNLDESSNSNKKGRNKTDTSRDEDGYAEDPFEEEGHDSHTKNKDDEKDEITEEIKSNHSDNDEDTQ